MGDFFFLFFFFKQAASFPGRKFVPLKHTTGVILQPLRYENGPGVFPGGGRGRLSLDLAPAQSIVSATLLSTSPELRVSRCVLVVLQHLK